MKKNQPFLSLASKNPGIIEVVNVRKSSEPLMSPGSGVAGVVLRKLLNRFIYRKFFKEEISILIAKTRSGDSVSIELLKPDAMKLITYLRSRGIRVIVYNKKNNDFFFEINILEIIILK